MAEASKLDMDHLRQWIGKSEQANDVVTSRLVMGLLATIDANSSDAAQDTEAPLTTHWCLAPRAVPMAQLGPDGHPARGGFLPPVPLQRRMWAGGRLDFHDRLRISDTVTRRSSIRDIAEKKGRSGSMCFVTVDHEISTGRGVAIREHQDIVYRGAEPARSSPSVATSSMRQSARRVIAPRGSRPVRADPVLFFRYSALSFNRHRIHYDRSYSINSDGYAGLVIHGPLQATLLVELAAAVEGGRTPRTFEFRSVRPLFDGPDFTVNADKDGTNLFLWTADAGGQPAMEATAAW